MDKKRLLIRIGLAAVLVVMLGGLGFVFYRARGRAETELALKTGEAAFAQGAQAFDAGRGEEAARRFQEAGLHASKVLDDLTEYRKSARSPEMATRIATLEGQTFWLKARALRDQAFAQALADGRPITAMEDSSTGAKFRNILAIPEEKARGEAVACLREAAFRLPEAKDVQEEALRTEVLLQPLNWALIEIWARNLVKLDPGEKRALFLLARFEFEQPPTDAKTARAGPVSDEKRNRERVAKSLEHLLALKQLDGYPVWRTLFLEAKVRRWLRAHYAARNKAADEKREDAALGVLFRKVQAEAPKLAGQSESLAHLSSWDVEGVFGLQLLALDAALEDSRKPDGDANKPMQTLTDVLDFCRKTTAGKAPPTWLSQAAAAALSAVKKVEPTVVSEPPPQWLPAIDAVQALGRKAADGKAIDPKLNAGVAGLLSRSAYREGKRGNDVRKAELSKLALQWVEDGLRLGNEAKLPPGQLLELHALAGEMKLVRGAKREALAPHLQALRDAKQPQTDAVEALLDGALAEREGRLEAARQKIEKALAGEGGDLALRGHLVLANVYLALGQPDRALASLRQVDRAYDRFELLSAPEKAWALAFLRSRGEVTVLLLTAHLETARTKVVRAARKAPDLETALEPARPHEEAVRGLLKRLSPQTSEERLARQALVMYHAATGRRTKALEEAAALRKDYPANLGVLRVEVAVLAQPPSEKKGKPAEKAQAKAIADADARARQFLADNPRDVAARLFWAEWLIRSRRADEAVSYLKNPVNFPAGKDERYERALAVALLGAGDREGGLKVLRHLAPDPGVDALMIQFLSEGEEREKHLEHALSRSENDGMLRCWKAALALGKGKHEEAARGYARALAVTRVKLLARQGLIRALFSLSETNPAKARELVTELLKENPDELVLFLSYAYASLKLDDVGGPRDAWEQAKNMASALDRCEKALLAEGQERVAGPLLKAEFWLLANRPDQARVEITRAVKQDPENVTAARLGLRVALAGAEPDFLAAGRSHLAVLKKRQPGDPAVLLMEAQLQEREGKRMDAVKTYESVLAKHPQERGAYAGLVALLEKQGESEKARDWVKRWRAELPHDVLAVQAQVRQLAAAGKIPAATKAAETFRDEEMRREKERPAPKGVAAKEWEKQQKSRLKALLPALEAELAKGFLAGKAVDEAEKWVRSALEKQPDLEVAELLLGDVYLQRRDWGKTKEHYRAMLKERKNQFVAANNLGWVLAVHLNDAEGGYRILQDVRKGRFSGKPISGDRLNEEFLDTIGQVASKLGREDAYAEMRDLFEAARRRYPYDARMFLHLGRMYAGLGEAAKAEGMFTAAVALAAPDAKGPLSPAQRGEVIASARAAQKKLNER